MSNARKLRDDETSLNHRCVCRNALKPAIQNIVSEAEQLGWSSHDTQLAVIEIAVDGLRQGRADLATMLELKRIVWRADTRGVV